MKIAIDSGPLTGGHSIRGVGVYTKSLIEALGEKVEAVDFRSVDLSRYDIVHYPYFSLFSRSLPLVKPSKIVVTIHDVIPLIYPKHYPPGIRGKLNFLLQKLALKNVAAIVTDTETSKKDICRFFGVQSNKVHVVYLAPRKIFKKLKAGEWESEIRKRYNLPERFVLYVGDVNYNKNIPNLVKACELAKIPLVICGKQAHEIENQDLNHPELIHLNNLNLNKAIRTGFVPDKDLVAIYNLATVYCQPSLYEGFGLPVLEAIACGCPVVAAKTQALVEIVDKAATFIDPYDPVKIAEGFSHLIKNPKLPREYSWEKTARETLEVYKNIL